LFIRILNRQKCAGRISVPGCRLHQSTIGTQAP
jgi:hypothetical protein